MIILNEFKFSYHKEHTLAYMYHCSNFVQNSKIIPPPSTNEGFFLTVPNLLVGTVRLSPVVAADSAIAAVAEVAVGPVAGSAVPVEVAVESASAESLSWHPSRNQLLPLSQ